MRNSNQITSKASILRQFIYLFFVALSALFFLANPIYAKDQATVNDTLRSHVEQQLYKAQKIKNENLNQAVFITGKLLENPLISEKDSLVNRIKFIHSLYLLLLDKNTQSQEMILDILPYYKEHFSKGWTVLLIRLGSLEVRMGNYEKAQEYFDTALPHTKKLEMPINEGLINIYTSDIYRFKSDFGNAFKSAEKALVLFEKVDRMDWISVAWTTLAYICVLAKDYEGASAYFDRIFEEENNIDNNFFLVKPTLYSGIMNFEKGNYDLAKKELEEGLGKINLLGNFPDISIVYQYTARICMINEDYQTAKDCLKKAISYAEKSVNKRQEHNANLLNLQLELITEPNKNNLEPMKVIYNWALDNEDNILLKKSSSYLSNYYQKIGDYKTALDFKEVYVKASEKNSEKEKLDGINLIKEKNKYAQEAIKLEVQLQTNHQIKNLMIASIFALMLMSGFLLYYYTQKRNAYIFLHQSNQELSRTEKDLATKNKELQKYIESNIQLEQFAHVASHDLRAPLITINSFAKLLDETASQKLNKAERTFIGYIRSNGEQMFALVNDLLEYSKINSQKVIISSVNVKQLVDGVITTLQSQAEEKNVSLEVKQNLPIIPADEIKLKRVFQNLISNAIKFSDPDKESRVEIGFTEKVDKWQFSVRDNGIGMKENNKDIFQPYVQLNRKADYKGTGLGLSFCQKIIQQHGGKIRFESVWGAGTIFYFCISKDVTKPLELYG